MNSRRKSPIYEHENSIKFLLIEVFFYIAVEGPLRVCDEQNELGKKKITIGKHFTTAFIMATFGMSRKFFIEALFCLLAMTMFYNLAIGNAMFESLQINVDEEEIMVHASQMPPKELKGEMHQMDVEVEAKVLTEAEVFQSVLDRAQSSKGTCDALPDQLNLPYKDGRFTNSSLPEFGVIHALSGWISKSETFQTEHKTHSSTVGWVHNLTCTLPPEKMCNVEGFSVIFMSHSLERLKELETGIRKVATWENTHEIILVWNSDPEILQHNSEFALLLQEYHTNPDHPLRIFYALQNGLENNLFNRYHPLVSPKMEVILYFDDDGPFFEEDAMNVGFELWKRDSARQVGSFPRNIRFTSDRMINQGVEELEKSIKEVEQGIYHKTRDNLNKAQSQFISTCQTAVGDKLEYNYFIFAQFQAHMMLPSGSFLHRDFLCWLWHPALEELRQFVLDHPTHPGKVFFSMIRSSYNSYYIDNNSLTLFFH